MGIIDFKEIPAGNSIDGGQDTFELFARDFFKLQGFKIVEEPDRGPDGGRDFIIIERRIGKLGDTEIKWLVSCKHNAHSGGSVNTRDEEDIPGRVKQFHCNGFIAFYSTICSSSLSKRINSYKDFFEICIFDHEKIERELLKSSDAISLLKRYFPNTYEREYRSKEALESSNKLLVDVTRGIREDRNIDLYQRAKYYNKYVYPSLIDSLKKPCSSELIDCAYYLADIYDRTSEYEKATTLADNIVRLIKTYDKKDLSVHQIRQLIGSIYTYTIVKGYEKSRKEKLLNKAEETIRFVKDILNDYTWVNITDKLFLEGLFASNYACFLMNKAEIAKEEGNQEERKNLLESALKCHKEAEKIRETIIRIKVFTDETGPEEVVERSLFQSKSNIASVLYHMGYYDEAITRHKEVLAHRIAKKELTDAYVSKLYIIGGFIEKTRMEELTQGELEECKKLIDECEEYYKNSQDVIRREDITKKKKRLEEYLALKTTEFIESIKLMQESGDEMLALEGSMICKDVHDLM